MPLFHFIGHDRPNSRELRMSVRPQHLAYAAPHTRLGGPLLDSEGGPVGSVLIVEAENIEAAKTLMSNDPYALAGLFERTEISPWRVVLGGIEGYSG